MGAVPGAGTNPTGPFALGLGEVRGGIPVLDSKVDNIRPNSKKPAHFNEMWMQNSLYPFEMQMQKGRSALYRNV